MNLLTDAKVFKEIKKDPTSSYQRKNNELIKKLKTHYEISEETAKSLMTYTSNPPAFYGLLKTHKQDLPIRPIISGISSPVQKLSKYLASILTMAMDSENEYNVKDTFEFAEHMNNMTLPDGHKTDKPLMLCHYSQMYQKN